MQQTIFILDLLAKRGSYEDLDGVFKRIWQALVPYPEWTILVFDEIAHIQHEPNEVFYRLLRGEGDLA